MSRRKLNSKGFTILELLIASAVFTTILLICSYALIQVGRVYYKGVTTTRTQEVARTIMDDITQSIQFSGEQVATNLTPSGGVRGICVDSRRFSFRLGVQLNNAPNQHVIVADEIGSCSGTVTPLAIGSAVAVNGSTNPREFMPGDMRLANLEVMSIAGSTDLYSVHVRVVSGDNDLLNNPAGPDASCTGARFGSQFCAVADITTTVQKRVN